MNEAINNNYKIKLNPHDNKCVVSEPYTKIVTWLRNRIHSLSDSKQLDCNEISHYVDGFVFMLTSDYRSLKYYASIMGVNKWSLYVKKNWRGLEKDFVGVDVLKACFKAALTFDLSREFGVVFDGRCVL